MEAVVLVLLSKIYLLRNVITKGEILLTVPINNSHALLRKTVTFFSHETLRLVSTFLKFTGLSCTPQYYTTCLLPIFYWTRENFIQN